MIQIYKNLQIQKKNKNKLLKIISKMWIIYNINLNSKHSKISDKILKKYNNKTLKIKIKWKH